MAFNKDTFERFAMQVETIGHNAAIDSYGASVDAISKVLNIEQSEGRSLARYMTEIGWAVLNNVRTPCLTLTPKGHEEIAKLRRPKLHRWFDGHPKTTAAIVGIITVLLVEAIKSILWPR